MVNPWADAQIEKGEQLLQSFTGDGLELCCV